MTSSATAQVVQSSDQQKNRKALIIADSRTQGHGPRVPQGSSRERRSDTPLVLREARSCAKRGKTIHPGKDFKTFPLIKYIITPPEETEHGTRPGGRGPGGVPGGVGSKNRGGHVRVYYSEFVCLSRHILNCTFLYRRYLNCILIYKVFI